MLTKETSVRYLLYRLPCYRDGRQQEGQQVQNESDAVTLSEHRARNDEHRRRNQTYCRHLQIHQRYGLIRAFAAARRTVLGVFAPQTRLFAPPHLGAVLCPLDKRHTLSFDFVLLEHRDCSRQRIFFVFPVRCILFRRIVPEFLMCFRLFLNLP